MKEWSKNYPIEKKIIVIVINLAAHISSLLS